MEIYSKGMYPSFRLSQAFSILSRSRSPSSISSVPVSCFVVPVARCSFPFSSVALLSSFSFSCAFHFSWTSLPSPSSMIELRSLNLFWDWGLLGISKGVGFLAGLRQCPTFSKPSASFSHPLLVCVICIWTYGHSLSR